MAFFLDATGFHAFSPEPRVSASSGRLGCLRPKRLDSLGLGFSCSGFFLDCVRSLSSVGWQRSACRKGSRSPLHANLQLKHKMRAAADIRATEHISMTSQVLLTTAKPQPYFAARSGPVNIVVFWPQDASALMGETASGFQVFWPFCAGAGVCRVEASSRFWLQGFLEISEVCVYAWFLECEMHCPLTLAPAPAEMNIKLG